MICRKLLGAGALALVSLFPPAARGQETADEASTLYRDAEVEAFYQNGLALIAERKFSEAVEELNKAIAKDGAYPEAYLAKGDALKELQNYQGAGNAYSSAINFDANMAAAYNGRGECYMEMTPPVYDLALIDFSTALNLDNRNAAALSNMGHVQVIAGQNPMEAMRVLDEALALNPEDDRAYRDRGMAHAQLREFDKAAEDVQRAAQVDGGDYENYSSLAVIYSFQDKFADAAQAWTMAIDNYKPKKRGESETFISGYINRADARMSLAEIETNADARTAALNGVVADANAVLGVYEDRFPESGLALYRRGRAERMLEQFSEAVDSLTRAIQVVPAGQDINYVSEAYMYRGICWYYIGDLDLARGDFERASSIGSGFGDPRIYLWIGFTYHKQEDFRRAIDLYSQSIAKAPGFSLAHVNKGRAYMDLSEYNRAIESFNDAILSEPENGDHYYNVGVAYIKLREYEKAKHLLNIALRKENPQPKMYRAMAVALRGLGRDDLAEEYDRQAGTPGRPVGATGAEGASPSAVQ